MVTKITLNITNTNLAWIELHSLETGLDKTIIVNKALALEKFMQQAIREGKTILFEDEYGNRKVVVLK